jgi:hypothetical protein
MGNSESMRSILIHCILKSMNSIRFSFDLKINFDIPHLLRPSLTMLKYIHHFSVAVFLYSICLTASAQTDTIRVRVSGKILSYNGQTKVPNGLFGVHAGNFQGFDAAKVKQWGIESVRTIQTVPTGNTYNPPAGINQVVDCWFDRFNPPRNVENPLNWKSEFYQKATQYMNSTSGLNREIILEFWNEPYLNWAYKPGVATDPQFFDTTGRTVNGPVKLKGKSTPEPFLKWKMAQWYASPRWAANRQGVYNAISTAWNQQLSVLNIPYPGLTGVLNPGETYYSGTSREFTVINAMRPVDTTQDSYYSGRQNSLYYNEMYRVLADTIRKLNPNLMLAAGWGFEVHKDNWTPWKNLFKPLIDEHHNRMDAIHEHHYSMDTRIIAADYEVMYAYAFKKYGRRFHFINTETGGYLDPQRPTEPGNSPGNISNKKKAMNAFVYNSKDIIYLLAHSSDKAYSRAIHEPQNTFGGARFALENLKTLRGNLLHAQSSHSGLWPVASVSGDTLLTLVCFNQYPGSQNLDIEIKAPNGYMFVDAGFQKVDTTAGADTLSIFNLPLSTASNTFSSKTTIPTLQTFIWKLRLTTTSGIQDTTKINQYFADSILTRIPSGTSSSFTISIPAAQVSGNSHSRLKCVFQNGTPPLVSLNGTVLPYEYQGDTASKNRGGITYISVPDNLISTENILQVTATGGNCDVWMASLEVSNTPFLTKVNPELEASGFRVYPNPFSNEISLEIPSGSGNAQLSLFDVFGRKVLEENIATGSETSTFKINTSPLKTGVYTGKITSRNAQPKVIKIIKNQ